MSTATQTRYREVQQFRQSWVWALLLASILIELIVMAIFAYGMVKQLAYGQPWGDRPMSDSSLALVGGLVILQCVVVGVGLPLFFRALKLITEVNADGLHVRFYPLTRRTIEFFDIRHCEARTYNPVLEYGGWGIRWGRKGTAYNVSGDRGVQLELRNGRRLLIGSQRADELARAIQAEMQR